MLVVGLTGGIGAGKSTVAAMFARRGATVIDVDAIGRQVLEPGGAACAAVVARFGEEMRRADGGIDRARLASVVFNDARALDELTAISHPAINHELRHLLASFESSGTHIVVLDMAVLVESRLGHDEHGRRLYGAVVVVEAPWALRLERLVGRGTTAEQAEARREAQATDDDRRAVADYVIVNDGDLTALEREVRHVWDALRQRAVGG